VTAMADQGERRHKLRVPALRWRAFFTQTAPVLTQIPVERGWSFQENQAGLSPTMVDSRIEANPGMVAEIAGR